LWKTSCWSASLPSAASAGAWPSAIAACRAARSRRAARHTASGATGAWFRDQRADALAGNARRRRRRQTGFSSAPPSLDGGHPLPLIVILSCARGSEKDQDQPVDLPRFRSRNAANSSEIRRANRNSLRTGNFFQFSRESSCRCKAVFGCIPGRFEHREFSLFGARRGDTPECEFSICSSQDLRSGNLRERAVEAHLLGQPFQRADAAVFEAQALASDEIPHGAARWPLSAGCS